MEKRDGTFEKENCYMERRDKMEKPTVFISYKRDKSDIVNDLEEKISGRAEIKRDTKEIGAWESINSFMNSIRKQDFAILVISDNYLKSVACMYEVLQLLKDDDWLNKTMIMLADDINIFGTKEQLQYIKYWNDKYNNITELIKTLPPETVSSQSEDLKKISRIKDEIGSFLHIISDRNIPAEDVYEQINMRLEKNDVSKIEEDNLVENVRLGRDAIALLITACNGTGILQVSTSLESYSISIGNNTFIDCSSLDNRTIAKWNDALSKLEYYGLISTGNDFLYHVTQRGYKASDELEKQIGTEKIKCSNCNYHGASDKKYECPICHCKIGEKEDVILDLIKKNSTVTRKQLLELSGFSEKTVVRLLRVLEDKGCIERVGNARTTKWKIS